MTGKGKVVSCLPKNGRPPSELDRIFDERSTQTTSYTNMQGLAALYAKK